MPRTIRLIIIAGLFIAHNATAKRDFYVEKEVRCNMSGFCNSVQEDTPLNGKLRQYYPSGIIKTEAEYKNGLRNGVLSHFYEDGKQSAYEIYNNGILNGGASTYYNTGNIKTEIYYVNGVLDGEYKGYYEDGSIKLEGKYSNGKKHGKERLYNRSGRAVNEIIYNQGTPISALCRKADGSRENYTNKALKYLSNNTTPCGQNLNE